MLVTNHVLSGALIGLVAPGPVSAFAVGVASHLVLDTLPHYGAVRIENVMHIAKTDGLVGLAVMAVATRRTPRARRWPVLAGMAGAAVLDLDKPSTIYLGFSPFPKVVDRYHTNIQKRESADRMPQEILVGLAGAAAVAWATRRTS